MAVTITVGTSGRNYSTWQLACNAIPSNISSSGSNTPYILAGYNDSEFYSTAGGKLIEMPAITTDSTNTITLTAAAGQSFLDNANVQTNALTYNVANGVGIRVNAGYALVLHSETQYVNTTRLQIKSSTSGGGYAVVQVTNNCNVSQCILDQYNSSGNNTYVLNPNNNNYVTNCLIIARQAGMRGVSSSYQTAYLCNCTIVCPSDISNTNVAIVGNSSQHWNVYNCAIFGFSAASSTGVFAGNNNCSDQAISFGSSNQASQTYSNQFVNTTNSASDFRLKSGSNCIDNGATETTYIPAAVDIAGTSRPQGTAWDIGCWEYLGVVENFTATVMDSNTVSDTLSFILYPIVPSSDITTAGWTATPSGSFYPTVGEVIENDSTYVTSPVTPTGQDLVFGLSSAMVAGAWTINLGAYFTGTEGQIRVHLQNSSNVDQGVSSWIMLTSSVQVYNIQVTTTGTATQVMIEVQ